MLYHERERKNKESAIFIYIVYLLTKLCNIFDEAFFIDVSICIQTSYRWGGGGTHLIFFFQFPLMLIAETMFSHQKINW